MLLGQDCLEVADHTCETTSRTLSSHWKSTCPVFRGQDCGGKEDCNTFFCKTAGRKCKAGNDRFYGQRETLLFLSVSLDDFKMFGEEEKPSSHVDFGVPAPMLDQVYCGCTQRAQIHDEPSDKSIASCIDESSPPKLTESRRTEREHFVSDKLLLGATIWKGR